MHPTEQMTELEIGALLDAHDVLVRACVESRLVFEEFMAAYGCFPSVLEQGKRSADWSGVPRLCGSRIAFHQLVAGVISGPPTEGDLPEMDPGAGRFLAMVGLMRLRGLVERYPDLTCMGRS